MNNTIKKKLKKIALLIYKLRNINSIKSVRQFYIKSQLKSCGNGVFFQKYTVLENPQCIIIGNNVGIGSFVHIWGKGSVSIGDNVLVGSHTAIVSETHDYTQKVMYNTHICRPVVIENNVWIGAHCVIMPGVTIKTGSVIGAGSIVTANTEPDGIYVGVPAKRLKNRF